MQRLGRRALVCAFFSPLPFLFLFFSRARRIRGGGGSYMLADVRECIRIETDRQTYIQTDIQTDIHTYIQSLVPSAAALPRPARSDMSTATRPRIFIPRPCFLSRAPAMQAETQRPSEADSHKLGASPPYMCAMSPWSHTNDIEMQSGVSGAGRFPVLTVEMAAGLRGEERG